MYRLILLGASNLTMSFPLVVRLVRERLRGRVEIAAAMGHGRSFGAWSSVFGRGLPGIVPCGLWEHLAAQPATEGGELALVTDIGNDLLYGHSVGQIVDWVESCLQRLAARGTQIVLTELPIESVAHLGAWRFRVMRSLLFPRNRMSLADVRRLAVELNERVREAGRCYGARLVEMPGDWYGFDPIHVRRRQRPAAWSSVMSHFAALSIEVGHERGARAAAEDDAGQYGSNAAPRNLPGGPSGKGGGRPWNPVSLTIPKLRRLRPAVRTLFGRTQTTPQPVLNSNDLEIRLY